MSLDPLTVYLNDHLAGSSAAVALLDHLKALYRPGSERRRFFATLQIEVEDDSTVLRQLIRARGGEERRARSAVGWLMAKLTAAKLQVDDPAGPLHIFEALEALELFFDGNHALWRALQAARERVPQARSLDLAGLERRAKSQYERAESMRLQLAPQALSAA
jgi:hypothetical protein